MRNRGVIWGAALCAALLRFPGALWPIGPDEAGFTLVARSWHPLPGSVYGVHWVDRPPLLIAVVKVSDWIGGPLFMRFVAALGCIVLVLSAAAVARRISGDRAAAWTAVAVAAITTNPMIDAVAAKGELLGLPVIMTSIWCSLIALDRRSGRWAFGAGLLAVLALGLKQNLFAGLVFGGVLLVVATAVGELSRRDLARLAGAAIAGALTPVVATLVWAVSVGVRLDALWYAVYGFRGDALEVLLAGNLSAPEDRAKILAGIVLGSGMALIIGGFLVHLKGAWLTNRAVTAATLAVVLADGLGLLLGGSYWRPYLFVLIPGTALCAAMLVARPSKRGLAMRAMVAISVASTVVSLVAWTVTNEQGRVTPSWVYTGEAIGAVAQPSDSLVVFGGRADLQFASGLPSPYRYLWSLPMRTLDPDYHQLIRLLEGPRAPTWFVAAAPLAVWNLDAGTRLGQVVRSRYELHAWGCDETPIFLLRGVQRPVVLPDCDRPTF
ncbi:glycosyltransferase family 39 protein [Nocardioides sp.]|uniref:glycosyltransferase family 39 protein n=1 Tax=Nocardioides sp. TaxID=35761 RepID=UPI003D0C63A6